MRRKKLLHQVFDAMYKIGINKNKITFDIIKGNQI